MIHGRYHAEHRRTDDQSGPAVMRARRSFLGTILLVSLGALVAFCPSVSAAGQGEGFVSREYPLKALFLYNFGGYVEWPESVFKSDDQPFVVGILGNAPVDRMLREIAATKTVAGRRIVVENFDSVGSVSPCQILFVSRDVPAADQQRVIERLRGLPVLIVGETRGFAGRGGCVNFYIESNKIRFEVNLEAAKQQQLRISAKLLALARIVK